MIRYHFLVLGTESRQKYLADFLKEKGHEVMCAENYQPGYHDVVLLPVSQTAEYLSENAGRLQKGQIVYGCNLPIDIVRKCDSQGIHFIDYMKVDGVASKNAIATAEGAIVEAIQLGDLCIQGSQSLVLGYGRCGSVLAEKLTCMKSQVTVAARRNDVRAQAESYGCQSIGLERLEEHIHRFEYIFNTIPAPVLHRENLTQVKEHAVIIDIASRPGGVDYVFCRENNITAKLCLGLPGIYAPKSSARILLEVIEKTILGGE